MATISENLKTIKDSTMAIKQAIIDKGGEVGDLTTYAEAIANLPSGDPNPTAEKNDVTFYDYDGTILHSYTAEQFLALSAMPPLPTQKGLICQEWNWSYEDAMEYVAEYGVLDVGATYITDDGKTRLYIRIAAEGRMGVPLYFSQSVANGVTIDWGDGSDTETLSGTGNVNITHKYASIGDYCISLDVADGCTLNLGHSTQDNGVVGSMGVYKAMVYKVEIGRNITTIRAYAFHGLKNINEIVIPKNIISASSLSFYGSYPLKAIIIPNGFKTISTGQFGYCYSIDCIILPNSIKSLDSQGFRNLSFSRIILPMNITSIGPYAFDGCGRLANLVIPNKITAINGNTFSSCTSMAYYDFSHHSAVPTLANTNAFLGIPKDCKIIVPDNLYDKWVAATNWSAYATYTIKKSDWDNLKQGGSL